MLSGKAYFGVRRLSSAQTTSSRGRRSCPVSATLGDPRRTYTGPPGRLFGSPTPRNESSAYRRMGTSRRARQNPVSHTLDMYMGGQVCQRGEGADVPDDIASRAAHDALLASACARRRVLIVYVPALQALRLFVGNPQWSLTPGADHPGTGGRYCLRLCLGLREGTVFVLNSGPYKRDNHTAPGTLMSVVAGRFWRRPTRSQFLRASLGWEPLPECYLFAPSSGRTSFGPSPRWLL